MTISFLSSTHKDVGEKFITWWGVTLRYAICEVSPKLLDTAYQPEIAVYVSPIQPLSGNVRCIFSFDCGVLDV